MQRSRRPRVSSGSISCPTDRTDPIVARSGRRASCIFRPWTSCAAAICSPTYRPCSDRSTSCLGKLTDREGTVTKLVLALACACTLLFALDGARAARPDAGAKTGEAAKPGADGAEDAGKPDEGGPSGGEGGLVPLAELVKDGFVIRTTDFIPADAVTRQSGKGFFGRCHCHVEKSTSTAVCFYTLKAYVGKKLTTIAACTVHH